MPRCKLAKPSQKQVSDWRWRALWEHPGGSPIDLKELIDSYALSLGYKGWAEDTDRITEWLETLGVLEWGKVDGKLQAPGLG